MLEKGFTVFFRLILTIPHVLSLSYFESPPGGRLYFVWMYARFEWNTGETPVLIEPNSRATISSLVHGPLALDPTSIESMTCTLKSEASNMPG